LARYGLLEKIGIHLIHGHFRLLEETVLVGTNYGNYRWSRARKLDDLDVNNIHGHIFALTDHGFRAYEYQTGKMPDFEVDMSAFLEELGGFLKTNNLETRVGFEVIDPAHRGRMMWELVLPRHKGTFMAPPSCLKYCSSTRATGWQFRWEDGELGVIRVADHAESAQYGHIIVPDPPDLPPIQASPDPVLGKFDTVRYLLEDKGILERESLEEQAI
jgi:hypothetical protein